MNNNAQKQIVATGPISEDEQQALDDFNAQLTTMINKLSSELTLKITKLSGKIVKPGQNADTTIDAGVQFSKNSTITAHATIVVAGVKFITSGLFKKTTSLQRVCMVSVDFLYNKSKVPQDHFSINIPLDLSSGLPDRDMCYSLAQEIHNNMIDVYVQITKRAKKSLINRRFVSN